MCDSRFIHGKSKVTQNKKPESGHELVKIFAANGLRWVHLSYKTLETLKTFPLYNAKSLREFRNLFYLVVLKLLTLESFDSWLQLMSSPNMPHTPEENAEFAETVLTEFIDMHADTFPSLSKEKQLFR